MAWNIEGMVNHLILMYKAVGEHGHEAFIDLAKKDPKKAIEELPSFIESVLSLGNNFFRGQMAGGPHPLATAPFIDTIGLIYPTLNKEDRTKALKKCLGFLDGLNYFNAQNNLELVHEPWLVSDIVANRWLYFCGYEEYAKNLTNVSSWKDFETIYLRDDGTLKCRSLFWLLFCLSRKDHRKPDIMANIQDLFPELIDRTKDAIATIIHSQGLEGEVGYIDSPPIAYKKSIDEKITHYESSWAEDIQTKLKRENWILLPDFFHRLDYRKKFLAERVSK